MLRNVLLFLCLTFVTGTMLSVEASAQTAREQELLNRLNRLQNEIETLSQSVYRDEALPPQKQRQAGNSADSAGSYKSIEQARLLADVEIRLSQLENELRVLTGRLEEQNHRIRILENRLGGGNPYGSPVRGQQGGQDGSSGFDTSGAAPYSPDGNVSVSSLLNHGSKPQIEATVLEQNLPDYLRNSIRNQQSGEQGKVATGQLGVLRVNPDGTTEAVSGVVEDGAQGSVPVVTGEGGAVAGVDPNSIYQKAFSLLRDKNYEEAEKYFRNFLSSFPDHNLVQNAKYWLGETYYVRDDFERAARLFAEGYQRFPEGSKAPDNLLKLGLSLGHMGNKTDACLTLAQIQRKFSRGAGAVLERAEQEMADMGCKN